MPTIRKDSVALISTKVIYLKNYTLFARQKNKINSLCFTTVYIFTVLTCLSLSIFVIGHTVTFMFWAAERVIKCTLTRIRQSWWVKTIKVENVTVCWNHTLCIANKWDPFNTNNVIFLYYAIRYLQLLHFPHNYFSFFAFCSS